MLEVGTRAPDFTLRDERDVDVSLSGELGHWVVLWWYPKAATPG